MCTKFIEIKNPTFSNDVLKNEWSTKEVGLNEKSVEKLKIQVKSCERHLGNRRIDKIKHISILI